MISVSGKFLRKHFLLNILSKIYSLWINFSPSSCRGWCCRCLSS